MPHGATIEQFPQPASAEVEEQLPIDLYEHYNDGRILNIMGVPGTLDALYAQCPKRDELTIEQRNGFLINAFNMSGETIDPQHVEMFTSYLEERGKEQKFTVKEPSPEVVAQREQTESQKLDAAGSHKVTTTIVKTPAADRVDKRHIENFIVSQLPQTSQHESFIPVRQIRPIVTPEKVINSTPVERSITTQRKPNTIVQLTTRSPDKEAVAPAAQLETVTPPQNVTLPPPVAQPTETAFVSTLELPADDDYKLALKPLSPIEAEVTPAPLLTPAILIDRLPALREALPEQPTIPLRFNELLPVTNAGDEPEAVEQLPIVTSFETYITEKAETDTAFEPEKSLALLEEVKQISRLLAEQALEASPEYFVPALSEAEQVIIVARLLATCQELLESLDMPADEETIKRLIFTLIQEEQLGLVAERILIQIDLSRIGTHEVKTEDWFVRFGQMLMRLQRADHSFIGRVALTSLTVPAWRRVLPA